MVESTLTDNYESLTTPIQTTTDSLQLAIERAIYEYKEFISITIDNITTNLTESFVKNYLCLEQLASKIQLRTHFLENSPSYLNNLSYNRNFGDYNIEVREFFNLKLILEENTKRIAEKLEEVEYFHSKLLNLIFEPSYLPITSTAKIAANRNEEQVVEDDENKENVVEIQEIHSVPSTTESQVEILSKQEPDAPKEILPQVERRRPLFDLHDKMLEQVQNSDSLEGFKKLMKRAPLATKPRTKTDLQKRYANSLYFFSSSSSENSSKHQKKHLKQLAKQPKHTKSLHISSFHRQVNSVKTISTMASNRGKQKNLQMELIGGDKRRKQLKCYDLLDDLDKDILAPIKSEYPRRDHLPSKSLVKPSQNYLQTMLKSKDDALFKKLIKPRAPNAVLKPPTPAPGSNNNKSNNNQKNKLHQKNVKALMDYLTGPHHQNQQSTVKIVQKPIKHYLVMMVHVYYDNFPVKEVPTMPHKQTECDVSSPATLQNVQNMANPISSCRRSKKVMLEHLKQLKSKNDSIQKNIQKAIDVIETKMIDLLSNSNPAENGKNTEEAFNVMEKEILNVLDMMSDDEDDESKKLAKSKIFLQELKMRKPITILQNNGKLVYNPSNLSNSSGGVKPSPIIKNKVMVEQNKMKVKPENGGKFMDLNTTIEKATTLQRNNEILNEQDKSKLIEIQTKMNTIINAESKTNNNTNSKLNYGCKKANIEEGERILGQVDNVIKTIDTIYTKFCETSAKLDAPPADYSKKMEQETSKVEKRVEIVEPKTKIGGEIRRASVGDPKPIKDDKNALMNVDKITIIPSNEIKPEKKSKAKVAKKVSQQVVKKTNVEATLELENKVEKEAAAKKELITIKNVKEVEEVYEKVYESVLPRFQEAIEVDLGWKVECKNVQVAENERILVNLKGNFKFNEIDLAKRHELILNAFYPIFFSGVLAAMNLNFTC